VPGRVGELPRGLLQEPAGDRNGERAQASPRSRVSGVSAELDDVHCPAVAGGEQRGQVDVAASVKGLQVAELRAGVEET